MNFKEEPNYIYDNVIISESLRKDLLRQLKIIDEGIPFSIVTPFRTDLWKDNSTVNNIIYYFDPKKIKDYKKIERHIGDEIIWEIPEMIERNTANKRLLEKAIEIIESYHFEWIPIVGYWVETLNEPIPGKPKQLMKKLTKEKSLFIIGEPNDEKRFNDLHKLTKEIALLSRPHQDAYILSNGKIVQMYERPNDKPLSVNYMKTMKTGRTDKYVIDKVFYMVKDIKQTALYFQDQGTKSAVKKTVPAPKHIRFGSTTTKPKIIDYGYTFVMENFGNHDKNHISNIYRSGMAGAMADGMRQARYFKYNIYDIFEINEILSENSIMKLKYMEINKILK